MKKFQGLVLAVFGSALALACGGTGDANNNLHTVLACEVIDGGSCVNGAAGMNTAGAAGDSAVNPGSDSGVGGNAPSTGGKASSTGGNQSTGGSAQAGASPQGGQAPGTGGNAPSTGGSSPQSTGGSTPASTGGNQSTTGGSSPQATGGSNPATGGSNPGTGGSTPQSTGGNAPSTGGSSPQSTGGSTPVSTGGNQSTTGGSSPQATGGSNPATGGSNPGTGGSSPQSTGGNQSTGGTSTGGTATGGSKTGGTSTGGNAPSGGSGPTSTGGTATGGMGTGGIATGGTAPACVPSPRPALVPDNGPAIHCTVTPDSTFPATQHLNGEIQCLPSGDCFLLSGTEARNHQILRKTNGAWAPETLPASLFPGDAETYNLWFYGISGTRLDNMWAVGANRPVAIIRRAADGTWSEQTNGLVSKTGWNIRWAQSIWASEDSAFVTTEETNPCPNGCTTAQAQETDAGIYQWVGSSWKAMDLPAHEKHIGLQKIWGTSNTDVFAVGCIFDAQPDSGTFQSCIRGVLWHYDGCTWSDLTGSVPQDVRALNGVHGSGGHIVVVGAAITADRDRPVRLFSTDLNQWQRSDGTIRAGDGPVWMAGANNIYVGSTLEDAAGNDVIDGARVTLLSNGAWQQPVYTGGSADEVVSGISVGSAPYIATQGSSGARVYTCQ